MCERVGLKGIYETSNLSKKDEDAIINGYKNYN